jgi:hypothetical protein
MSVSGSLSMLPLDRPPSPGVLALLARAGKDLQELAGQVSAWSDRQRQIESDRRAAATKASMSRIAHSVFKRRRR